MKKIVFFDLDGTLIHSPSTEKSFLKSLCLSGSLKFKQWLHATLFIACNIFKYKQYVFIKNKAYLSGLRVAKIENFARNLVEKELLKCIRPVIKNRLLEHQKNGDITILLTGAHEFIAKVFAEHLNFTEYYATKCILKDGYFTSKPPIQHPFRDEKLSIAKKICAKYNVDLKDCAAYGDSFNDKILLNAIGHAVVVNPDFLLKLIAKKKDWEII